MMLTIHAFIGAPLLNEGLTNLHAVYQCGLLHNEGDRRGAPGHGLHRRGGFDCADIGVSYTREREAIWTNDDMTMMTDGLAPMHPGELLRDEVLPSLNRPKVAIARMLEISPRTLYRVLAGKQDVTPSIALRLAKLLGQSPQMWLNLQRNYDLRIGAQTDAAILERIPTLR